MVNDSKPYLYNKINLNHQGENKVTRVILPNIRQGEGSVALYHQRNGDLFSYPVTIEEHGDVIYWIVSSIDTAVEGVGSAELQWVGNNKEVLKSKIYTTYTEKSITPPGKKPDPLEDYAAKIAKSAADAKKSEDAAARYADAAYQAGTAATESAERAAGSASAAAKSEETAAASADAAKKSEDAAARYADAAYQAGTAATESAERAAGSASAAAKSEENAAVAADAAKKSEDAASESAASIRQNAIQIKANADAINALTTRLKSGALADAELHLGFYLDADGDLCQQED